MRASSEDGAQGARGYNPPSIVRGLWAAAAFLVLCALAGAQEPPSPPPPAPGAGKKVAKVRFEGDRRYTEEFLREQVASKEGEAYDPGLIARDSQVLRQYFAAVADTIVKEVDGGVGTPV